MCGRRWEIFGEEVIIGRYYPLQPTPLQNPPNVLESEKCNVQKQRNTGNRNSEIHATESEKCNVQKQRNTCYRNSEIHATESEKYMLQKQRNACFIIIEI